MAIGTIAAIGLGLGAVGQVVGASSANKAAGKAADVSLEVAEKNNALTREIYGKNERNFTPFMQTGNAAMGQVNALLGIPDGSTEGGTDWNAFVDSDPWRVSDYNTHYADRMSKAEYGKFNYNYDMNRGRAADPNYGGFDLSRYTVAPGQAGAAARNAFDTYRNSTGYQFRLGEGMNALNSGYAGRGVVQSGAAMRAAQEYGQNFASAEFNNYLGALTGQQGVGLSATSALAGVGQNYVNNVTANNNSAGSAAANALIAKGANNPFAGAIGMVGGGLYGYGR